MASSGIQRNFDTNDMELIQQQMSVDDGNKSLPESTTPTTISNDTIFEKEWGHNGTYPRRMTTNNSNPEPQLNVIFNDIMSKVELFEAFFVKDFIKDTSLVNINNNNNGKQLTYSEFI